MDNSIAYIYVKFEGTLRDLAQIIKHRFNIANQNPSSSNQEREGLNMGGEYYLFEFIGLELRLIVNKGEVFESEFSEYQYYIVTHPETSIANPLFKGVIEYLAELLRQNELTLFVEFL